MKKAIETTDAQRAIAITYYKDPLSDTFGNAEKSLIKAGFDPVIAKSAVQKTWFQAHRAQTAVDIVSRSEQLLKKYLDIDINLTADSTPAERDIVRIQADLMKFGLERLASGLYNKEKEAVAPNVTINVTEFKRPTRDAHIIED